MQPRASSIHAVTVSCETCQPRSIHGAGGASSCVDTCLCPLLARSRLCESVDLSRRGVLCVADATAFWSVHHMGHLLRQCRAHLFTLARCIAREFAYYARAVAAEWVGYCDAQIQVHVREARKEPGRIVRPNVVGNRHTGRGRWWGVGRLSGCLSNTEFCRQKNMAKNAHSGPCSALWWL